MVTIYKSIGEIQMKTLEMYISEFSTLNEKSVTAIFEVGLLLTQAKDELNEVQYDFFLKQTKFASKTSTERKWIAIGNAYIRLKNISDMLPPNWTTIYLISTMPAEKLDPLMREKLINPSITASELNGLLNQSKQQKNAVEIILQFQSGIDADAFLCIKDEIASAVPPNTCDIGLNKNARYLIQQAKNIT